VGLFIAICGALALAVWGVMLFRRGSAPEARSQTSSHTETNAAQTDPGIDGSD
jgi:hypothetical protein